MPIPSDTLDGEWERRLNALGDKLAAHEDSDGGEDDEAIYSDGPIEDPRPVDGDDLDDADDNDVQEYFSVIDKWNHEVKVPETLDELISALEDVRDEIGGDATVVKAASISVGEDGAAPGRLAVDYGVAPDGKPMVLLGDRGYAPVLRDDGLETDSGLLLEQGSELVAQDYEEEERLISDVIACALAIDAMDDVHSVAAANRVRREDPTLFKIASRALGLWNDGEGPYSSLDEAAATALEMERL